MKYKKFRRVPLIEEPELRWHVNTEGSHPEIQILIPRLGEPDISRVHPAVRKQVCHALRDYVRFFYLKRMLCKKYQGKVLEVNHLWSVSNHFLGTGRYTRFVDWGFVFRAREGCVPLNGCRRWIGQSETSRQCRKMNCTEVETLSHVLNHCNVHWKAIKLRYNAIQNRLVAPIPEAAGVTITTDKTVPDAPIWLVGGNKLRPDIVITDTAKKKMKIVDVAVAF